jgi:CPA2 family monovalent cation:H+ antiporter-2
MATATWWGWNLGAALVFGLALSVASTVVLLLVLLPPLAPLPLGGSDAASGVGIGWTLAVALAKVASFIALTQENIGTVFMGEHELAAGMTRHVLARTRHVAAGHSGR